jgi:hypothetical protein
LRKKLYSKGKTLMVRAEGMRAREEFEKDTL